MTVVINIAKDFTRTPGTRYKRNSDFSGEMFRDEVLLPNLKENRQVTVILDGTAGYTRSFLEEAFGGLVRVGKLSKETIESLLEIKAEDPAYELYKDFATQAIEQAFDD